MKLVFSGQRELVHELHKENDSPLVQALLGIPLTGMEFPLREFESDKRFPTLVTIPPPVINESEQRAEVNAVVDIVSHGETYGSFGRYDLIDSLFHKISGILTGKGIAQEITPFQISRIVGGVDLNPLSREYLLFIKYERTTRIVDLGSLAGTWINGEKIGINDWPHLEKLQELAREEVETTQSKRPRGYMISLLGLKDLTGGRWNERDAKSAIQRLSNMGSTIIKDGDQITLGRDYFQGEDYSFTFREERKE